MSRLYKKYREVILPALKAKHPDKCLMALPVLKKIVISMGLGDALKDKNALQEHSDELALLSGQKPIVTRTKNAISNFKLRENQPVGLMVTLRGKKMYDFLDRFCSIVSPRIRDFRGFLQKGDGRGNYNFGIVDQQIFPEINLDKVKRVQGMNVTLVTTASTDEGCIELLTQLGFPFK
ncbi:MAG: 50S ribosomal protein L5 [uncultured bacterium]|nr:MAG: 50S ribosomal protein L5 [uncultured bacterium]OGN55746.1 MAG: 50S ribosomal protein L5 [Chlamydiae bacterium RIFCSPHIGHO2_01_FULL_44_39]OGN58587.1 MAG: 50S ribosomal protein L5 [Chlamydiae bacterium RIFCSPHIGHO2_02_FULL_45_9]OGN60537.1 MAG: 50S ribosomal protein L5 [Chlamydiae bacterium RIFCSPHIGHO2_12_FULL_44_59]OGN65992.1 MAG: 50S ribosomal protein L5 [Chlamydiae bacterium RIFCSPLOWO2_01_FULL_44_52]OGN68807.1 MAG: 50S ribosomal protein L5 [Chlamydiae bacterium RIFCSPLOWO2_02_FULL_45